MPDRRYNPAVLPPESAELPGALAALLRAPSAALQGLMPGGVAVYESDESVPGEAAEVSGTPWLRVVVREPVNPYGSALGPSLARVAPVELVAEASADGPEGWPPRKMVAAAHAAAYADLVGQRLDLDYAHAAGEVFCSHSPPTAAYDADVRAYYATAVYRLLLTPLADEGG